MYGYFKESKTEKLYISLESEIWKTTLPRVTAKKYKAVEKNAM